jgi:hypothetical protein
VAHHTRKRYDVWNVESKNPVTFTSFFENVKSRFGRSGAQVGMLNINREVVFVK